MNSDQIIELANRLRKLSPEEGLSLVSLLFPGKAVFSTSFGLEDQAVLHLIASKNIPISVFTLDTGRLFPETYSLWSRTRDRYGITIETYSPQHESLQKLISEKGPNSFYENKQNREECCFIRKVEPLNRALQNVSIWVTGIRAEQSINRESFDILEWDASRQLLKYHPLLFWKEEELKNFVQGNNVPYNVLHDKGFPSIGCAPCTRAVLPGQDARSGRWWWEDPDKKECGLHESKQK